MANYFTKFSCLLDVGTWQNAARALELYDAPPDAEASAIPFRDAFLLSTMPDLGVGTLWFRHDETGDPESLIQFVKQCAGEFGLTGHWGFQYANTCSRLRFDGFGGGAHVLDLATGESISWTETSSWLACVLDGGEPDA